MKCSWVLAALLALWPAAGRAEESDDEFEQAARFGKSETKLDVVPVDETHAQKHPPPKTDDPVRIEGPLVSTAHRDEGQAYLDPYFGHAIYPQLGARLLSGFVTERFANSGEPAGAPSRMAVASRVDLSLWALDLRFPFNTQDGTSTPMELALKIPFGVGRHRFAPIVALFVPVGAGLDQSLLQLGLGYHVTAGGFGLHLEASGYSGGLDRTKSGKTGGVLGWNGSISWLASEHVGFMFEVDGTTALSEHLPDTASMQSTRLYDSQVKLVPAIRIFPSDSAFRIGLAGQFDVVSSGYDFARRRGVLFDIGYVFL